MIIYRLSERPDLLDRMYEVDPRWPEFMGTDPVVNAFFGQVAGTFPRLCAVATDASDAVVATGRAWRLLVTCRVGAPCPAAAWTG